MQEEFGADRLVHFENHVGDDVFQIPETEERADWYGVSGIPHVRIDGLYSVVGASSCEGAASQYRSRINQRIAETGGMSPVEITGSWMRGEWEVKLQADFRLVDPATLTSLRATLLVYEDDCLFQDQLWQQSTRAIYDEPITLTNAGDVVHIETTIEAGETWSTANMHCVAYLQQTTGNKMIIQGAVLPLVEDFALSFESRVRSVPAGSGEAVFDATLTNLSGAADAITVEIGAPFPGWTTRLFVCGDPNPHTEPVEIVLGPDESCELTLRVATDGTTAIGAGSLLATSAASQRTQTDRLQIYNGSPAIFLVDDDWLNTDEAPLRAALEAGGYLHRSWDIMRDFGGASPALRNLAGFDIVIWQTGWRFNYLLTQSDMATLMQYMDEGGSLFLSSQEFLDSMGGIPNSFVTDYLGISGWQTDKGYERLYGAPGDPIGDGLDLPLSFPFQSYKQGDHIVPGADGVVCFTAAGGWNAAVRHELPGDGGKSVMMASAFNALSEDDPDPNNARVVLSRIVEWLTPPPAMDAVEPELLLATRIAGARPNPFNPRAEIRFSLSTAAAASAIRLEIVDPAGRRVAVLHDGPLTAGPHSRVWDGRADRGIPASSGVYLARLSTVEGVRTGKLLLLR